MVAAACKGASQGPNQYIANVNVRFESNETPRMPLDLLIERQLNACSQILGGQRFGLLGCSSYWFRGRVFGFSVSGIDLVNLAPECSNITKEVDIRVAPSCERKDWRADSVRYDPANGWTSSNVIDLACYLEVIEFIDRRFNDCSMSIQTRDSELFRCKMALDGMPRKFTAFVNFEMRSISKTSPGEPRH
jgi:hypothetical protein